MPRELPYEHQCPWREEAEALRERLQGAQAQVAQLQRQLFGAKSERMPALEPMPGGEPKASGERMPSVQQQLRKEQSPEQDATRTQAAQQKRRDRAARKAQQATVRRVFHPVPQEQRQCPTCGSRELEPLGQGRVTVVYEYIPARLERQEHVQEVVRMLVRQGRGVRATAPEGGRASGLGVESGSTGSSAAPSGSS